jgi:osmotically-inducible protein OsmY
MADDRGDWRRDRDRPRYSEWRRVDDDRGRYGRSEYGRGEAWGRGEPWRGSEAESDWRRDRGDYGRGYQSREDWDRGSREWERDYPRSREGYGREAWGRAYDPDPGRRAVSGSAPGGAWGFDEGWGRDRDYQRDWESTGYDRPGYNRDYSRDRYGERSRYGNDQRRERGWWDRTSDEVSSWFGDESAERRRQQDERERYGGASYHRGRGPRGYARSDERIREDVSDRLSDNPILDASDIEVTVSSGEVTLGGSVDSRYSKRLAEDLAEEVSGVKHVQNNLRVRQTDQQRMSISGTSSGISEQGATSDAGRLSGSGVGGSTGTGNTSGIMTGTRTAGTTSGGTSGIADQSPVGGTTSSRTTTTR